MSISTTLSRLPEVSPFIQSVLRVRLKKVTKPVARVFASASSFFFTSSTVMLAQPQLLVTLGSPEPGDSFLQLGLEFEPSHNFPAEGVRGGWNFALSPVVRWVF